MFSPSRRRYNGVEGQAPVPAAAASTPRRRATARSGAVGSDWIQSLRGAIDATKAAGISGIQAPVFAVILGPIYRANKQRGLSGPELVNATVQQALQQIRSNPQQLEATRNRIFGAAQAGRASRAGTPRTPVSPPPEVLPEVSARSRAASPTMRSRRY